MIETELYEGARYYAKVWALKERRFVDGLASTDPAIRVQAISDAGGYFRISRSLRTVYDVAVGLPRLKSVLDALDRIPGSSVSDATLARCINELRREIGRPYGNLDVLSAATKFLWLRHRDVVVIHDSQARIALGAQVGNYADYLDRWRAEYSLLAPKVTNACERLQTARKLGDLVALEAKTHSTDEWFKRRVFDIYLWKKGGSSR